MFTVGQQYSKLDIYELLGVPANKRKGEWNKGYRTYGDNIFIFSNVGIPGRTGHDYNNYWDGDLFVWEATKLSNVNQPQIKKMLSGSKTVLLFTRTDDRSKFTFEGIVIAKEVAKTAPVQIIWQFKEYPYESFEEKRPALAEEREPLYEGHLTRITINKYERNPLARRMCIEHHGTFCNVCSFDFYITYGELGKGYIHVHHLIPISSLGESYTLTPETDLIPVCPNCHSMIHKQIPPVLPDELKEIINDNKL
jgi:5-methylcytosine-specific restriction enzyme A